MKRFIRSIIRPKTRSGKFRLASILGLLAAAAGFNLQPEVLYPSLGKSPDCNMTHPHVEGNLDISSESNRTNAKMTIIHAD